MKLKCFDISGLVKIVTGAVILILPTKIMGLNRLEQNRQTLLDFMT
jgi:hypothetical protein